MNKLRAIWLLLTFTIGLYATEFQPVYGSHGMVVTEDPYATEVGLEILKKGGNAIDAAVAVGFTLAVAFPTAGNIGGGGFMVIREHDGKVKTLDYRETAPAQATENCYLDANGQVIENASILGYKAAGVPGTVAGLEAAHKKYGKLPWKTLLAPAIKLAEEGIILSRHKTKSLNSHLDDFLKFPSTKKIFTKNGAPFEPFDRLKQPELAQTLRRIAKQGSRDFYHGETARLIARDMERNNGWITLKDLKKYQPVWRAPVHFTYRGYDLYSMPLPSSGGIVMAEILNTLEAFDLSAFKANSSDAMHLWIEAERQAYADRAVFMGDPAFVDVPVEKLISKSYAAFIRGQIDMFHARKSEDVAANEAWMKESFETTHFSIVDQWGNAVSNTYTLNSGYGSKAVVEGAGFLLNNEMDDFSIKPGVPNQYGLVGSYANKVEPGKRMLSSMTPTIVSHNDSLFMVVGAPGGSRIITAVTQVISAVIDHRYNMRTAIEKPRFHHQWKPDVVFLEEPGFTDDTIYRLQAKGHHIRYVKGLASVQGILLKNGLMQGWSDPRRAGVAKGY
ncbi:MAG: gamma-glutamyltransferase [Calditrichaeota bacterium]|nr:MAG: gamma-glutamyltransferase [Calditrichota bacterium]